MRGPWTWNHYWPGCKSTGASHKAVTHKKERLFNKCKKCGKVDRGVLEKWKNGEWTWRCPYCIHAQRYPR